MPFCFTNLKGIFLGVVGNMRKGTSSTVSVYNKKYDPFENIYIARIANEQPRIDRQCLLLAGTPSDSIYI